MKVGSAMKLAKRMIGDRDWTIWKITSARDDCWYKHLVGKNILVKHFGTMSAYDIDDNYLCYYDLEYIRTPNFQRLITLVYYFRKWLKKEIERCYEI